VSSGLRVLTVPAALSIGSSLRNLLALCVACSFLEGTASPAPGSDEFPRLEVRAAGTDRAWVAYGDQAAFGYGLSPQHILTMLPPGETRDPDLDFRDFVEWADAQGITVVRSYPPSFIVGPRYLDLFERASSDPTRFDLTRFNDAYFERLREASALFRDHGIFVDLQLWQAVQWKPAGFQDSYYHPDHNVNPDLARHAGPGEFVIDPSLDPALLDHQKEHVRRILDATGDLGHVFYDVMNEIGNGTGANPEWVEAMLDEIEIWERETGLEVLVGLNDEGRDRAETGHSLSNPRLQIAFLDLGRHDQHLEVQRRYRKPTFGVRNIDWNPETEERRYFYGENDLTLSPDPGLHDRSRRMYWRMFLARCQMNAGYADPGIAAYRMPLPESLGLRPLRWFTGLAASRFDSFRDESGKIAGGPGDRRYLLLSPQRALLFLESLPGTAGRTFPEGRLRLEDLGWSDGEIGAWIVDPRDGRLTSSRTAASGGTVSIDLPAFRDELALVLDRDPEASLDPTIQRSVEIVPRARVEGGKVLLEWDENPEGRLAEIHRFAEAPRTADTGMPESGSPAGQRGPDEIAAMIHGGSDLLGRTGATSFRDDTPPPGTVRYRVAWWSGDRRELAVSDPVDVAVPDVPPPTPRIRIFMVSSRRAGLWATGSASPDNAGFEWQRRSRGGHNWEALSRTRYHYLSDATLVPGRSYEYRVRAIDRAGQTSEFSQPVAVETRRPGLGRILRLAWRRAGPLAVAGGLLALAAAVAGLVWWRRARSRRSRRA
jgi:hypothetical protein